MNVRELAIDVCDLYVDVARLCREETSTEEHILLLEYNIQFKTSLKITLVGRNRL